MKTFKIFFDFYVTDTEINNYVHRTLSNYSRQFFNIIRFISDASHLKTLY